MRRRHLKLIAPFGVLLLCGLAAAVLIATAPDVPTKEPDRLGTAVRVLIRLPV